MSSKLETLLADGTLHRIAPTCRTRGELAEKCGMTPTAYESSRKRIRRAGRPFPEFPELQRGDMSKSSVAAIDATIGEPFVQRMVEAVKNREANTSIEISMSDPGAEFDEAKTDPNIRKPDVSRFPSLAAFDDPPLPAMPDGHRVRGVSTLVDADGQTKAQWIKTTAVDDGRKDWLEAIREMAGDLPRIEPVEWTEPNEADTLSAYLVGDPHAGLMAWHEDAGENFDLKIAERNLVAAFGKLIALAPPSREGLIVFIGDNTHSDGQSNTTTKGTRVDVDGRTIKMMRTIVSIARRSIEMALVKHERVHFIVERGNHDELLSAMLALALGLLYENEPRVTIDQSPEMFHWYRFGSVLIGTHHGDKAKPMDLLGVMAVDRQADWGETRHRRFYCGHYHHLITKEVPGLVVDYLPTLAASDAWHRSMGYRSSRAMYMDVFDRNDGHVNRHIVGIDAVVRAVRGAA